MINFYEINPNKSNRKKTIIMFHGWGSTIESQIQLGKELSEIGYKVVIPELKYHDSRQALHNHFDQTVLQTYFWKTIFETIDEENEMMNCLQLQKENTILLGSSMGGFISSGIFFSNTSYAGLININGSSSFIFSENDFRKKDGRIRLENEELSLFEKYDPKNKNTFSNKPMLFLHGEKDMIIPISGQFDFLATNNSIISFLKYEDVNHSISNKMKSDLLNWLEKSF
ncbi:alpha/beta hydrolase [Bacillus sp. AFS041924]|uniref:alpha/beta hydrolase n=1 Tax=Bacillus sp. AFS041924 TaxID=2033503 RepID=UPI000BFB31DD|nr:alpha/beta hydrolase [Bacillus sp. AFS041924]PGS49571.1 phospholipase [Bacillus sp. AFS041924]